MFIISPDRDNARRAITHMRAALQHAPDLQIGAVQTLALKDWWLHWFAAKPADNLHVFANGVVLGKLDFNEANQLSPIQHEDAPVPAELHPLLLSTRIVQQGDDLIITPNQMAHVFAAPAHNAAADSQLVLAASIGAQPDPMRLAVFSNAGYFPGNLSLFAEIDKIPLLHAYSTRGKTFTQTRSISAPLSDDEAMIARFAAIVPQARSAIGLSAGYDSRFILGCLLKAGVRPRVVHKAGQEEFIVRQIAEQLGLQLDVIAPQPSIAPHFYTLMNDALIYMRGGNFNRVRAGMRRDELFFNGSTTASALKSPMRTAWKAPFMPGDIHQRLIRFGIMGKSAPATVVLRQPFAREAVEAFLYQHLTQPQQLLVEWRTAKQWANWYYFINRGARWTYASFGDLGYYTYPVYLAGDVDGTMLGVGSSAWSNFRRERSRAINHALLPDLRVNYLDGLPYATPAQSGIRLALDKINYEYLRRFRARQRFHRQYREQSENVSPEQEPAPESGAVFARFYNAPLHEIVESKAPFSEKRAARTLHYVLEFLESAAAQPSDSMHY